MEEEVKNQALNKLPEILLKMWAINPKTDKFICPIQLDLTPLWAFNFLFAPELLAVIEIDVNTGESFVDYEDERYYLGDAFEIAYKSI